MRSLFVYCKLPPVAAQASVEPLQALHAAWVRQWAPQGLQARLYRRADADAQGRVTCMATYHARTGLAPEQAQQIVQALQAAWPGCHVEAFDELPG
jgi:hypothetical protein